MAKDFSTPLCRTQSVPVPAQAMHFRKPRRSTPSLLKFSLMMSPISLVSLAKTKKLFDWRMRLCRSCNKTTGRLDFIPGRDGFFVGPSAGGCNYARTRQTWPRLDRALPREDLQPEATYSAGAAFFQTGSGTRFGGFIGPARPSSAPSRQNSAWMEYFSVSMCLHSVGALHVRHIPAPPLSWSKLINEAYADNEA